MLSTRLSILVLVFGGVVEANRCAHSHEDCSRSGCCIDHSKKCYKKNNFWASCRPSCTPGIHEHDPPGHKTPWSCEVIDEHHPDCATDGGNCIHLGCCKTKGHKCFLKDAGEAFCMASKPMWWIGHEIRPDTAKDDVNCIHTGQCGTPGHKCFLKGTGEAFCRASRPAGWIGHEIRPHRPQNGGESGGQNGGEGGGSSPEPKPQSPRWGPLAVGAMIATISLFVVSLLWVLAAIFRRHTHVPKNSDSFLPTNNGSLLPAE